MRFLLGLMGLLALISTVSANPPEVDTAEVLRRGDSVTVVGEGPRSGDELAWAVAWAPPPDDSHKWQITVITIDNCPACTRLIKDFETTRELAAFVAAPEEAKAWAHFFILHADDETQAWRLKDFKHGAKDRMTYPTLVVQPPRNGMWGNPRMVVYQSPGGYDGNAARLAAQIRDAVNRFCKAQQQRGYPKQPIQEMDLQASSRVVGGACQLQEGSVVTEDQFAQALIEGRYDPPFQTPRPIEPFHPQLVQWPPVDQTPVNPTPPPHPPSGPTPDPFQSGGLTGWLLIASIGLNLWLAWRAKQREQGRQLLIDGPAADKLIQLLTTLLSGGVPAPIVQTPPNQVR